MKVKKAMTTQLQTIPAATLSPSAVQNRITGMIEQGRQQAGQLLQALATDYIEDEIVKVGPGSNGSGIEVVRFEDSAEVFLRRGQGKPRTLHAHAAEQLGEKLSIPGAWLRDQLTGEGWQRDIGADLLATTLANTKRRERLLMRSIGGQVRGVLSDSYRRISSPALAEAGASALQAVGAVPYQARATDLKWEISAILPTAIELPTRHHGVEIIGAGVRFGNSDFGDGAQFLSLFLLRMWCSNGAIGESLLRQVHLGRQLPDDIALSDRTYRLDTQAQASLLGDLIRGGLGEEKLRDRLQKVQANASETVAPEEVLGGLVRAKKLTKAEAEAAMQTVAKSDPAQVPVGPATRYKLGQALSWISKAEGIRAERTAELEALAGSLILS